MFSLATTLTPGPNNFMIMNSGLNHGLKKSMPHFLGICFGFPLMVLSVALGFGVLFLQYDWLKQALKIIGSLYMLYLAWCIVSTTVESHEQETTKPMSFMQALLFQWANPKAWMMAIGAISIFTIAESELHNAMAISATFFIACLPCIGLWLIGGAFLQKMIKNETQQKWFNRALALSLVASIAPMLID